MVATLTALFSVAIASLVLVGWTLDMPILERCFTAAVTMNPMTATAILLIGLSLTGKRSERRDLLSRTCRFVVPILVLAMALTKMSDLVLSTSIQVDSRLFAGEMAHAIGRNKMAPNAALSFALLSGGMLLLTFERWWSVIAAQMLTLTSCFFALLALIGYAYGVASFFGLGRFTPMAPPTALCFVLLAASVLASTSHVGMMRCICSRGPSGRMAMILLPASFLVALPLGLWRLLAVRMHLVTEEFAITMSTVIIIGLLVCVTWIGAQWLYLTDRKREVAEGELRYRASRDFLTGLVNRSVFFDRVQQRLLVMRRHASPAFAVFYLDIDGFKQINDQLGHAAGDEFLMRVARILEACSRGSDTVARLGGDEFAILFNEIKQTGDTEILADRISAAFPTSFGSNPIVPVGVSMGIALSQVSHTSPEDMLRDADKALYAVKRSGKGRAEIYVEPQATPVATPARHWRPLSGQNDGALDDVDTFKLGLGGYGQPA